MISKRAAAATQKVIHHWNYLLGVKQPVDPALFMTSEQCALCDLYLYTNIHGQSSCATSCPIVKRTGKHHCRGTPYHSAVTDMIAWGEGSCTRKAFRQACARQLRFLESLLKE